ncbi:Flp pilus assembly protein CpaB [Tenuibacillus multivorans]|uniref:Pilus assembly protein CpaB n=1 Tax=Tenuibacillus multivorans TaxID=237069 RepID=A0A1G9WQD9_9BACI|nr:Flp pilus assembly protein CpaB [Tenuibacillus multivorans]GEL77984.1 hypothetical protein TMU01_22190 [Tenuibacillus multivorans]SDM86335.1 pilus assembly protein CpaB [Tenuibacillus multivorans]
MQSRIFFLLAILMGIITTAIFFYTNQNNEPAPVEETPVTEVVVLTNDVSENQRLTGEDVTLKAIPKDQAHAATLSSVDDVQGKFATAGMVEGEVVLSHRLKSSKEEQRLVSRKVRDGYRAVSIDTDMVRSVTNLIEPEDYVDVIFTYQIEDEAEGEGGNTEISSRLTSGISENLLDASESVILLEEIRVLSVGRKMVTNPNGGDYVEYSQVTLELPPRDVVALVNASEQGSIHLALHSRIVPEEEAEDSEE